MQQTWTSKLKKWHPRNWYQPSHPAPRPQPAQRQQQKRRHEARCEAATGDTYRERRWHWEQHRLGTAAAAATTTLHSAWCSCFSRPFALSEWLLAMLTTTPLTLPNQQLLCSSYCIDFDHPFILNDTLLQGSSWESTFIWGDFPTLNNLTPPVKEICVKRSFKFWF